MSDKKEGQEDKKFAEAHVVLDMQTFELAVKSGDPIVKQLLEHRVENLNRKVEQLSKGLPPVNIDPVIHKTLNERTAELDKAKSALADATSCRASLESEVKELEERVEDKNGLSDDEREKLNSAYIALSDAKIIRGENEKLLTGIRVIDDRVVKMIGVLGQIKELPKTSGREFRIKRIGEQFDELMLDPYFSGVAARSRN